VPIPDGMRPLIDERQAREDAAIADVDARVVSGALSAEQADREFLELVLRERFAFLPTDAIDQLRTVGLELLEEPEIEETRTYYYAPDPDPATESSGDE
jgi:hypothetical protein